MTNVRVVPEHDSLAALVSQHLGEGGFVARPKLGPATCCVLRVRDTLGAEARAQLLERLKPLAPTVSAVTAEELGPLTPNGAGMVDAELLLGARDSFDSINLRVSVDEPALAETLNTAFTDCGFEMASPEVRVVRRTVLRYGGAPPFLRQVIRFVLARRGLDVPEACEWSTKDKDVWLELLDPDLQRLSPRERYAVTVRTDDTALAAPLIAALSALGCRVEVARLGPTPEGRPHRFAIDYGSLALLRDDSLIEELRETVRSQLAEAGVDEARFPLVVAHSQNALGATVSLPLASFNANAMRPYGTCDAARFPVTVFADDPDLAGPFLAKLEALGFVGTEVKLLGEKLPVVRLSVGTLRDEAPLLLESLKTLVTTESSAAASGDPAPVEERTLGSEDERVLIVLPLRALAEDTARSRVLGTSAKWNVVVYTERGKPGPSALLRDLRAVGFRNVRHRHAAVFEANRIQFGGAPDIILASIRAVLANHTSEEFQLENEWGELDDDIFISLPSSFATASTETPAADAPSDLPDLALWVEATTEATDAPFLEARGSDTRGSILWVGGTELPMRRGERHPLAPALSEFQHFCLDDQTAATLLHLAQAVVMREPCLLEGETSTAKTSSILYLAAHLGQPVLRVNLHGQTDTGELVGRYVPDATSGGWRWQEGLVLRAMREGCWLLLDELNLAEPQVLERFNSLLEREPALVVNEHEGERIAGEAIHSDFRIFGTMNPAEYAGRSALSPAWRDRFRAHRLVPAPGEPQVAAFLEFAVSGRPPTIEIAGRFWLPEPVTSAPWSALNGIPGVAAFLKALARFHVSLERSLASADAPGRSRRDRYVVTRRNLLSILDWLLAGGGTVKNMRGGLVRYYVERVAVSDRAHVLRLLDAAGIGPRVWSVAPQMCETSAGAEGGLA